MLLRRYYAAITVRWAHTPIDIPMRVSERVDRVLGGLVARRHVSYHHGPRVALETVS